MHFHNRTDVDPQHLEEPGCEIHALCAPEKVVLEALKASALISLGSLSCHGCEGLVLRALLLKMRRNPRAELCTKWPPPPLSRRDVGAPKLAAVGDG